MLADKNYSCELQVEIKKTVAHIANQISWIF